MGHVMLYSYISALGLGSTEPWGFGSRILMGRKNLCLVRPLRDCIRTGTF